MSKRNGWTKEMRKRWDEFNALEERRMACLAAMNGIDDPQAFVQRVRDAVEAGAIDELYLSFIREHLKESPRG